MTELVWNPPSTEHVLASLQAGTRPPEALARKVQEAGLRLVDPQPQAFGYYSPAATAYRRNTTGYPLELLPNLCQMHSVRAVSYWGGSWAEHPGRLDGLIRDTRAKTWDISEDGHSISLAIPTQSQSETDVYCHTFHNTGGGNASGRHWRLRTAGQGLYIRILRPIVRRFGFDIEDDRVAYKTSRSLMGVTVERSVDVNQNGLFNSLVFGQSDPSFEYYSDRVVSVHNRLLGSSVITPEALGIDRDTWTYVGDRALLEDPVYYHFVNHVLTTTDLRGPISRRNDATVDKALAMASKRASNEAITSLDNILEVEVVQAAARHKAEQALASQSSGNEVVSITADALSQGMLELVGGKPATVRILAKQVEARARLQAAQHTQQQADISEAIDF